MASAFISVAEILAAVSAESFMRVQVPATEILEAVSASHSSSVARTQSTFIAEAVSVSSDSLGALTVPIFTFAAVSVLTSTL